MLTGLQPIVSNAVMEILATLYESGIVEQVNLADVLQLFGVPSPAEHPDGVFLFSDPEWVDAYLKFRGFDEEDDHEITELSADDLGLDRKLH